MAYILLCRGQGRSGAQAESDLNEAQKFYGIGTRLLRDRLTNPDSASSDGNIQAVLLLIAFASDNGSHEEARIHKGALSRMIRQRGGLSTLETEVDSTLMLQLHSVPSSVHGHLTLRCGKDCLGELRFSQGLETAGLTSDAFRTS